MGHRGRVGWLAVLAAALAPSPGLAQPYPAPSQAPPDPSLIHWIGPQLVKHCDDLATGGVWLSKHLAPEKHVEMVEIGATAVGWVACKIAVPYYASRDGGMPAAPTSPPAGTHRLEPVFYPLAASSRPWTFQDAQRPLTFGAVPAPLPDRAATDAAITALLGSGPPITLGQSVQSSPSTYKPLEVGKLLGGTTP